MLCASSHPLRSESPGATTLATALAATDTSTTSTPIGTIAITATVADAISTAFDVPSATTATFVTVCSVTISATFHVAVTSTISIATHAVPVTFVATAI